jgi:hypothetical protein
MLRRALSLFVMALVTLSLSGSVYAAEKAEKADKAGETTGKITKVGEEGREITVSTKEGKEIKLKISGSRTTIDGVKSRSDLKEGQNVTVEHEGDEAKKIKVIK